MYWRNSTTGEWVDPGSEEWFGYSHLIGETIEFQSTGIDLPFHLTEDEYRRLMWVLPFDPSTYTDAELSESDGLRVLSVHFDQGYPEDAMPPVDDLLATLDAQGLTDEQRAEIAGTFADMPTSTVGELKVWIDDDFLVQRTEMDFRSLSGDRVVHEEHRTSVLTLHNEAELPGPLPD